MSRIYNDSNIFCPIDSHTIHQLHYDEVVHLSKLYFCPNCQSPKSKFQCSFSLQAKFCSNCLTDYTNSVSLNCTKNCFCCPECSSNISISIKDKESGKSFTFSCNYCSYTYTTNVITTPKSLNSILRLEKSQKDYRTSTFNQFKANLLANSKTYDEITKKNLALSNLLPQAPDQIDLNLTNDCLETIKVPYSRKLTCKYLIKCLCCNSILSSPKIDKNPTINKYSVSFSAVDFMPTIKIVKPKSSSVLKDKQYIFVVNVINPLPHPIEVTLNTIPQLSSPFIQHTSPLAKSSPPINVTVPTSKFTVKPSGLMGSDEIIKQIPTTLLTKKTTVSTSELILRVGNTSNWQTENENLEHWHDSGNNWYQVSVVLAINEDITEEHEVSIKVPLFVTIKSELPEAIRKVGSEKTQLSLGYWNIIDLGKVTLGK